MFRDVRRLVRFLLISFSDRRVLDEAPPDSTQSARDRQSIHHWPTGDLQGAQASSLTVPSLSRPPHTWPETSSKSISGETHCRLAEPWPVRLAFQLEAHPRQSTILSNVTRLPENPIRRVAELESAWTLNFDARFKGLRPTFQETSITQWQKN
jgi:hypothetical protein